MSIIAMMGYPVMKNPMPFAERLSDTLHDPRIRIPAIFIALVMGLLSIQRLTIYLAMNDRFTDIPASAVFEGFQIGLRFDFVMACTLTLPPAALLLVVGPGLLNKSWYKLTVIGYCSVFFSISLFLCIVDYYFFKEFDQRLDYKVLEYLEYDYIYKILWDDYPLIWVLAISIGTLVLSYHLFHRMGFRTNARYSTVRAIIWPFVIAPVLFVGIRGSLGPKAINNGPAYFSDSMSLSQLTLNGLFTLREAMDCTIFRNSTLSEYVKTLPEEEAFSMASKLVVRPEDDLLGDPENPLLRITSSGKPENKYNVVLVILESLSWHYIEALGGESGLTPHLDEIAAHGILMDRCFAVGSRSPFGFSGVLCGFPDLVGQSVTRRSKAEGNFLTLGRLLKRRGYETMFLYGGDPLYDHRKAFLGSNGFSRFVCRDEFDFHSYRTHLGWCDEDLFRQADKEFDALGDKPFLAVLFTLSFHRPYKVPDGKCEPVNSDRVDRDQLNCVRYTDWAIGRFMEAAKESDYFENTLFVFVADHTGGASGNPISPASYRIPFIIYAPKILGDDGRRISSVCSQTDVSPTIMSLLGGDYRHCFIGSSVLDRPAHRGLALMQHSGYALALMNGNQEVVVIPCGSAPHLYRYKDPDRLIPFDRQDADFIVRARDLKREAIALFESAEILFQRNAYHIRRP